jgi:hypothetical protein
MDEELKLAEGYRTKAREAKVKAASMPDSDIRETMLQIAADYESMANTLEALLRSRATLKRLEDLG